MKKNKFNINTDKYIVKKSEEYQHIQSWHKEDKKYAWFIPCYEETGRNAHIWDYSDTHLGFFSGYDTPTRPDPKIRRALRRLEYVEFTQEGDYEYCVRFPRERLDEIAEVVGARKAGKLNRNKK